MNLLNAKRIETLVSEFCAENQLSVQLSFEMPAGYETAFGTYDVTVNTLFFNLEMLKDAPEYEVLFYLYHELRHAAQYLHPEMFGAQIQESRVYVILYNGICYKLASDDWQECALEGDESYFTNAYLSLPYEVDANTFAYEQVKAICGDSPELQELYNAWMPEKRWTYEELKALFCRIEKALSEKQRKREFAMLTNTEFRKPSKIDIEEINAFKREFEEHKSGMDGTGTLFRDDAAQWLEYNRQMEAADNPSGIPSLQYGLFRKVDGRLLGLLQIRLELKGYLIDFGGNIGYCVRPSERRKGYAKEMLRSALDICREKGLSRVLVTCLANNIGSAKTIEACGGVFEKTMFDDRNYKADMKRYWIEL